MNRNTTICHTCGHKSVEYTFTFNQGLAAFLWALFRAGGPCKTDSLNLTYSQRTNSQKLRYWDLARPHMNEESAKKAGWWEITEYGRNFVLGKMTIVKKVVMRNNEFVRYEGKRIRFEDSLEGYMHRSHYREQIHAQILAEKPKADLFS